MCSSDLELTLDKDHDVFEGEIQWRGKDVLLSLEVKMCIRDSYVDLDERWLFDLAKDPEGRKPTVTWQTYNRGGVLYGSYDEMFISLLLRKVENPRCV